MIKLVLLYDNITIIFKNLYKIKSNIKRYIYTKSIKYIIYILGHIGGKADIK